MAEEERLKDELALLLKKRKDLRILKNTTFEDCPSIENLKSKLEKLL